jgi:hypothetical protein
MTKKFLADLAERAASTYAQAFLGLELAAGTDLLNVGGIKVAAIAALPAALSVIKSALAGQTGDKSASLVRLEEHQGA